MHKLAFAACTLLAMLCLSAAPALAQDTTHLENRIQELEQKLEEVKSGLQEEEQEQQTALDKAWERISLSGLLEVEGYYHQDFQDEEESSLEVATAEVGLDADLHDNVSTHILFLWEEGENNDNISVDEAFVSLGNFASCPAYGILGRQYVPFGAFETHMVSDPLSLEMGETQETAALLGFEHQGLYGSGYLFNGDVEEKGSDSHLDNFGLSLGYAAELADLELDLQLGYMNNMADTDGISDELDDEVRDYVDGGFARALLASRGFTFIAEYISALEDFEENELQFDSDGARPSAWNLELGYSFDFQGRETTLAAAYQGTDQALGLDLPEHRYLAVASMGLFDNLATLSLEYAYDEDYSESKGGTGDEAHTVTTQLAVEF
ncbi:MAG: LbtU family siderophore porin [Thermodesulfobacteriota bacterium]